MIEEVKRLVDAKDFAGLNAMADKYRRNCSRTSSGVWELTIFYGSFSTWLFNKENQTIKCDKDLEKFAREWRQYDPQHPSSYIVEADAYMQQAWCFRGSGTISEVDPEKFPMFRENTEIAQNILEHNKIIASVDPQYYATLIEVYKASGKDPQFFKQALYDALTKEPYYYSTYFAAASFLLPRWRGRPGDVKAFAELAEELTYERDGYGMYARIYWILQRYDRLDPEILDWGKVKLGMRDIANQYPDKWNLATFAHFACKKPDLRTAAFFFKRLEDNILAPQTFDNREWYSCLTDASHYLITDPNIDQLQ